MIDFKGVAGEYSMDTNSAKTWPNGHHSRSGSKVHTRLYLSTYLTQSEPTVHEVDSEALRCSLARTTKYRAAV